MLRASGRQPHRSRQRTAAVISAATIRRTTCDAAVYSRAQRRSALSAFSLHVTPAAIGLHTLPTAAPSAERCEPHRTFDRDASHHSQARRHGVKQAAPTNGETMRAIVQARYGTDADTVLELADIGKPTIDDDQVLVRVAAASLDMGTWHCMTGLPYAMRLAGFGVRSPKASNPGRTFAGTIESVGNDVTEFEPGDEVYGTCNVGSAASTVPGGRCCCRHW